MYFGLAGGFNARARAANFEDGELGEVMAYLHARGVKGFVTLNVLVRVLRAQRANSTTKKTATSLWIKRARLPNCSSCMPSVKTARPASLPEAGKALLRSTCWCVLANAKTKKPES